jgi:hypothetical protein
MKKTIVIAFIAATLNLAAVDAAHAGRTCESRTPTAKETAQALDLAQRVAVKLEAQDVQVAVIARIGSDQSARGMRYTHLGFVQRDHPKGRWIITHALNTCGGGLSNMYDEGLGNFFLDEMYSFESSIFVPSPVIQQRLMAALQSPLKVRMHEPTYSAIAYPFATDYQNSNGWVVELLAAAYAQPGQIANRQQAQAWLKAANYRPRELPIGASERAGARLFVANVRFGDHPNGSWAKARYQMNAADDVLKFVFTLSPSGNLFKVDLSGDANATLYAKAQPAAPTPTYAPFVPEAPLSGMEPVVEQSPAVRITKADPVRDVITSAPNYAATISTTTSDSGKQRLQLLQSTRGLVASYACRDQGYLRQCLGMTATACEAAVTQAVTFCFAGVSDQAIFAATSRGSLAIVEEIGYCAVNQIDADNTNKAKIKPSFEGKSCASPAAYK